MCIERKIDVVNISLGCDKPSLAVEQMLEECVLNGIACIVAAGSTGRAVQYPASSPWTLAVSAIGRFNEYPPKTWERTTVLPGQVAPDGVYSPTFTCFGPEVAVCAPGVGIISTVPHGGFEPQSGSSVAAPHVTGLAALLLAHHPWFAGFSGRNHLRVGVLFNMIRSMCIPYAFAPARGHRPADPSRAAAKPHALVGTDCIRHVGAAGPPAAVRGTIRYEWTVRGTVHATVRESGLGCELVAFPVQEFRVGAAAPMRGADGEAGGLPCRRCSPTKPRAGAARQRETGGMDWKGHQIME